MRKMTLSALALAILAGCAAGPRQQPATFAPSAGASATASSGWATETDTQRVRAALANRRDRLKLQLLQEELDALRKEIAELEARLEVLEKRDSEQTATPSPTYTPSGATHVGPRGGVYTISPSGKKVYKKR